MARARMIRAELRTSDKVASWPLDVRYFFVLLWGYVDDHGKGKDNPRLIKADCFPLDDDITPEQIDAWLDVLSASGVIVRYTVDGNDFLAFPNWAEHQKVQHAGKDIFPDFRNSQAVVRDFHEGLMKVSGDSHEGLTLKLSEVKLTQTVTTPTARDGYSPEFESWWKLYPRKTAKGIAYKAFKNALDRVTLEELMAKTESYANGQLPEERFIPHPGTWLNADRWNDEVQQVAYRHHPPEDDWMYPNFTPEQIHAMRYST